MPLRPVIPNSLNQEHHPNVLTLMQQCWSDSAFLRPSVKRIKKEFNVIYDM